MPATASDRTNFEHWLGAQMYRAKCPSTLTLGEYAQRLLSGETSARLAAHLTECPACRTEMNFWQTFLADEVDAVTPVQMPGAIETVRRLVAVLQSPSGGMALQPVASGLRGAAGDQLTYEAEGVQIFIDVQQDPAQSHLFVIHGLVIGLDSTEAAEAELSLGSHPVAQTAVDGLGNFSFASLTQGEYQMVVRTQTVEIEIVSIAVD